MDSKLLDRIDLYHGLFRWHQRGDGHPCVSRYPSSPTTIPCPTTGRLLRVATLEAAASAICPSCATQGQGGFVSFEGDLRMAYACPQCLQLVWVAGV
ncbi:MAG: hypothetical protein AUH43_25350 [Acidobacteria bacterium 13_1_40CM_65_14]|nr:MAG: hypothetical protein AUH43_25350 [Acidobacteria bacterium 13_1_40CM_65_14]